MKKYMWLVAVLAVLAILVGCGSTSGGGGSGSNGGGQSYSAPPAYVPPTPTYSAPPAPTSGWDPITNGPDAILNLATTYHGKYVAAELYDKLAVDLDTSYGSLLSNAPRLLSDGTWVFTLYLEQDDVARSTYLKTVLLDATPLCLRSDGTTYEDGCPTCCGNDSVMELRYNMDWLRMPEGELQPRNANAIRLLAELTKPD